MLFSTDYVIQGFKKLVIPNINDSMENQGYLRFLGRRGT